MKSPHLQAAIFILQFSAFVRVLSYDELGLVGWGALGCNSLLFSSI